MTTWILLILLAYLTGSIPFGVLLGRAKGIDIRAHGSKNVGATNVARVLGRPLGLLCFGLDMAKGAAPVVVAGVVTGAFATPMRDLGAQRMWLWLAVAVAAMLGHMFSLFLKLKGGKGVATGFGAMLAMWPLLTFPALFAFAAWYLTLRLTKYVSLASMIAACSLPLWCVAASVPDSFPDPSLGTNLREALVVGHPLILTTATLALLVVWKHRANIARLRRGEEPKVRGLARRGDFPNPPDEHPPTTDGGSD